MFTESVHHSAQCKICVKNTIMQMFSLKSLFERLCIICTLLFEDFPYQAIFKWGWSWRKPDNLTVVYKCNNILIKCIDYYNQSIMLLSLNVKESTVVWFSGGQVNFAVNCILNIDQIWQWHSERRSSLKKNSVIYSPSYQHKVRIDCQENISGASQL